MKRCRLDCILQVYMHALMYVDIDTRPEEDYFIATKKNENHKKTSTPGPVPNHWLGFSCIRSEYYEFDMNIEKQ